MILVGDGRDDGRPGSGHAGRDLEPEGGSDAANALDADFAAHQLHELLRDRQAEARAAGVHAGILFTRRTLLEGVEY